MTEGRSLTCQSCGEVIQVFEFPEPFTDPETFWCVPCMDPRYWGIYPQSRAAVESRRREKHFDDDTLDTQTRWEIWEQDDRNGKSNYDPHTVPIPY